MSGRGYDACIDPEQHRVEVTGSLPAVRGAAARGVRVRRARTDFDPVTSDADFLVEFAPGSDLPPPRQFFGLAEALEELLGRHADLVEPGAIRNPYIRASINRAREIVYGS